MKTGFDVRRLGRRMLGLLAAGGAMAANPARADVYFVTNEEGGGVGSLTEALQDANGHFGADVIKFNIPGGGRKVIHSTNEIGISSLNGNFTTLDGTTQPGYSGTPLIHLDGIGFTVFSNSCIVKGLSIANGQGVALYIGGVQNKVENCVLGYDPLNPAATSVASDALSLYGSNCIIGGAATRRNYIAKSRQNGIFIAGRGNTITFNTIGLDPTGTARGNSANGIFLNVGADGNKIGGPGEGNIISSSGGDGIRDQSGFNGANVNKGNTIEGNFIGLSPDGLASRPNGGIGVHLLENLPTPNVKNNVIAGNGGDGVRIETLTGAKGTQFASVTGNIIGLNAQGGAAIANGGNGVSLLGDVSRTYVGLAGAGNIIAGNAGHGIRVSSSVRTDNANQIGGIPAYNEIQGNRIGLNSQGSAVPNGGNGILIEDTTSNTLIGGTAAGEGNLISGNTGRGLIIQDDARTARVLGNTIGLDAAGTGAAPNLAGVLVQSGPVEGGGPDVVAPQTITIGGAGLARNIVSGNINTGIRIAGGTGVSLSGNIIGLNAAGTGAVGNLFGVDVSAPNVTVGTAGVGNIISGNRNTGLLLNAAGNNTTVTSNFIGLNAVGSGGVANALDGIEIRSTTGGNTITNNIIGASARHGINIGGAGITGAGGANTIVGNTIGTNGTAPISNNGNGIFVGIPSQTINANVISSSGQSGLYLNSGGNSVKGNRIGTNGTGDAALPNLGYGIESNVANVIGGLAAGEGNLISGNGKAGVWVTVPGMQIIGNRIGVAAGSAARIPNLEDGIALTNANRSAFIQNNVIAGNGRDGVRVQGTGNCTLQGNFIGSDGTTRSANGLHGIFLVEPSTLAIGNATAGNIISGNNGSGVYLNALGAVLSFNKIGTNAGATGAIPNGADGVTIAARDTTDAAHLVIGTQGSGNIISGNSSNGVRVINTSTGYVDIRGNFIGTNVDASSAIPNAVGVLIQSHFCTVGGVGQGNFVSGNTLRGVMVNAGAGTGVAGTIGTKILGNVIGLNGAGSAAVANGGAGVLVTTLAGEQATLGVTIGGTAAGERNVVSGNVDNGVRVVDGSATILGNFIGTNAGGTSGVANGGNGVQITTSNGDLYGTEVGGVAAGQGNRIAFNTKDGINYVGVAANNHARGNAIYSNSGLGINLQPTGEANSTVTPNDLNDGDVGPNFGQNFPIITSVTEAGGNTMIAGSLNSITGSQQIDVYASSAADPSGYGEGETFVGSTTVFANGSSAVAWSLTITGTFPGKFFSATATRPGSSGAGGTSEFSLARQLGADQPSISVRDVAFIEGNAAQGNFNFYFTLSSAYTQDVTVNVATANGPSNSATAGSDYDAISGIVTIPAGETSKLITVRVNGDTIVEPDETFVLNLSNATNATIADNQALGTIQNDDTASGNQAPVNGAITPNAATNLAGEARVFTATYSDPDGANDINLVAFRVSGTAGTSNTSVNSLLCLYNAATNKLSIFNDAANAPIGSVTPGTDTPLSNSQGTLNCKDVSVSKAGNVLTVNWNVSASGAFAGTKQNTFLFARDTAGLVDNYERLGTWTIGGNVAPRNMSIAPVNVSDAPGVERFFTTVVTDANGFKNLLYVTLRLGGSGTGSTTNNANAMVCVYNVQNGKLYLFDNKGNYVPQAAFPGSNVVLSNSQGSLNAARSVVTGSGTSITIKWSVKATAAFAGTRGIALLSADRGNLRDGYDTFGTWTITGAGGTPVSNSVSKASASGANINLVFTGAAPQSGYSVMVNDTPAEVASVGVQGSNVGLSLSQSLHAGDAVIVSWNGGSTTLSAS